MYYSPPGSSVHVIFQARVLEWVAVAFSSCLTALQICPDGGIRNLQRHPGIREALPVTRKPAAGGTVSRAPPQGLRGAGTAVSYSRLSQHPLPCRCECPRRPPPSQIVSGSRLSHLCIPRTPATTPKKCICQDTVTGNFWAFFKRHRSLPSPTPVSPPRPLKQ